jgi:hypothetical protein
MTVRRVREVECRVEQIRRVYCQLHCKGCFQILVTSLVLALYRWMEHTREETGIWKDLVDRRAGLCRCPDATKIASIPGLERPVVV